MLWWPILATIITALAIIFNSDLEYDLVGMFGGELWQEGLAIVTLWVSAIVIFWVSAISFANGWDAVSDFTKWIRRMKCNALVSSDIKKLHDLLK